jgi:hypothetical protein
MRFLSRALVREVIGLCSALFSALSLPGTLASQQASVNAGSAPEAMESSSRCFLPRPLARCRSYIVTEFGLSKLVTSEDGANPDSYRWDLGVMYNRPNDSAVGGTVALTVGDAIGQYRFGVRGRYRRWMNGGVFGANVSPGVFVWRDPPLDTGSRATFGSRSGIGLDLEVSWSAADWLSLVGQVEHANYGVAAQVGVRVGSLLGITLGPLAALGLVGLASGE